VRRKLLSAGTETSGVFERVVETVDVAGGDDRNPPRADR
jgi:hypothetical protein